MTEVSRAELLLQYAEGRVDDAKVALRAARIAEAAGNRLPVSGGLWDLLRAVFD